MRWLILITALVLLPQSVATDTPAAAAQRQTESDDAFVASEQVRAGDSIPFPVDI